MSQDALEGRPPDLATLFGQGRKLWKYIVCLLALGAAYAIPLLVMVAMVLGFARALGPRAAQSGIVVSLVLVAIPVIYVSLGFSLAIYEVTYDDEVGPVDALRRSWRLADGHRWALLGLGLVGCLAVLAGLLACCIGTIPAYAFFFLVFAVAHRALRNGMDLPTPSRPTRF
jgi:hypothetical protein